MFKQKHIHFVGIGGIGMSAIAQVLFKKDLKSLEVIFHKTILQKG